MPIYLSEKKQIVTEVAEVASRAISVVAVDYRCLTSPDMTSLREKARTAGVNLRVVRNTLARRAFSGTEHECINEALKGPVLLAFSCEEPGANARLMRDYAKENDKLEITALSIGGKLLDRSQVDTVANLPTRDEAIAKLMSVMQAPIVKLARTIAEPKSKLVRTIAAIRDKKQSESA